MADQMSNIIVVGKENGQFTTRQVNSHLASPIISGSMISELPKSCLNENVDGFRRSVRIDIQEMIGFRCFPSIISLLYKNKLEETGGIIVRGPPGFKPTISTEKISSLYEINVAKGYKLEVEQKSQTAECFTMVHTEKSFEKSLRNHKEACELKNRKNFVDESRTEDEFWNKIYTGNYSVDYAAGVDGNAFDQHLDGWNLEALNDDLKICKLFYEKGKPINVESITSSQFYLGQLHSAFVIHCEEYDLGAVSYLIDGQPKVWWTIPPALAPVLEQKMAAALPNQSRFCSSFLRHKQSLVTPHQLDVWGIPYNKLVQYPGDFVILPSKAYHMVMNRGSNWAQAINYCTAETYDFVKCHSHYMCYCNPEINQIMLHDLILKYEPERLAQFLNGKMEAFHPSKGYSKKITILNDKRFHKHYYEQHLKIRQGANAINPFSGKLYPKSFISPRYDGPFRNGEE